MSETYQLISKNLSWMISFTSKLMAGILQSKIYQLFLFSALSNIDTAVLEISILRILQDLQPTHLSASRTSLMLRMLLEEEITITSMVID